MDQPVEFPPEPHSHSIPASEESSLELPSIPSPAHSLSPSPSPYPAGILTIRSRAATLPPSSSSSPNINIKFAPLPQLAPRRRKSAVPLGIAARGNMMRKRRMMYQDAEEQLEREREMEERRDAEDPFLLLGKAVKGKWKKMVASRKHGKNNNTEDNVNTPSIIVVDEKQEETSWTEVTTDEEEHTVENGDRDEEDKDDKSTQISQTKTIKEGEATFDWLPSGSNTSSEDLPINLPHIP